MKQRRAWRPATGHEEVYHAAIRCQGKRSGLTPYRLRGVKKACPVEGKKTGAFASSGKPAVAQRWLLPLRNVFGMRLLSSLEGRRHIALVLGPQSKDDPDPDVSQSTHSH